MPDDMKDGAPDETVPSRRNPSKKADGETAPHDAMKPELPAPKANVLAFAQEDMEGDTQPLLPVVSAHIVQKPDVKGASGVPPWTLQQFFNGEIDLDIELSKRFPNMPVLSLIRFRTLGTQSGRSVATLMTQDEAVSVVFDADTKSKVIQISFTFGSMITLRFVIDDVGEMDRERWLELMRREQGGLAFLWGPHRWDKDYVICISRKYFTNLYAFSPRNFEASIRMTPAVTKALLDWLETFWDTDNKDNKPPELLTW